jgi:putative transposase
MPYWRLYFHFVWSTRTREPVITNQFAETIKHSLRMTANEHGAIPHAIGIMPEHVHFAVSVPPKISISDFMQEIKGGSSHDVNQSIDSSSLLLFRWQSEYGVISFSEDRLPRIVAYVENQARHHAENKLSSRLENDGSLPEFRSRKVAPGRVPGAG